MSTGPDRVRLQLDDFDFLVIQNLPYLKYRQVISEVMVTLTFGEGLDAYFIETVFSGGIGAAVFNTQFFTRKYRRLPFIYDSYEALVTHFASDVFRVIADPDVYSATQAEQFAVLEKDYNFAVYRNNIAAYYKRYFEQDHGILTTQPSDRGL